MKKSAAFILVIIALIAGYRFGYLQSQHIPSSRSSLITLTASPTATPPLKTSGKANTASLSSLFSQYNRSSSKNTKTDLYDYVANKKTKKFHKPSCSSVDQMKESNKKYFYSVTRQSMIDKGYDPCGNCHP